jgi:hypothetical protein
MPSHSFSWCGRAGTARSRRGTRTVTLLIEQWLADLSRIEQAAEHVTIPVSFASEAYTLGERIDRVRPAMMAQAQSARAGS